jgi:starvation-inducible DNA-binding protein
MRLFEMCGAFHQPVIDELNQVLSDTFALYFKTHTYHWNVEGMFFHSLHDLFGKQYTEMWESIDEIAEQIRQLGAKPATAMKDMMPTVITNGRPDMSAKDMIIDLRNGHSLIIDRLREAIRIAQNNGDEGTADLFIQRIKAHQKHMWMLASSAKEIIDSPAPVEDAVRSDISVASVLISVSRD